MWKDEVLLCIVQAEALLVACFPVGQSLQIELPVVENLPAVHGAHVLIEVAPTSAEYLPEGHCIQVEKDVDPHLIVPTFVLPVLGKARAIRPSTRVWVI